MTTQMSLPQPNPASNPAAVAPAPVSFAQRVARSAPAAGAAPIGFLDQLTQSMAPDAAPILTPATTPPGNPAAPQAPPSTLPPAVGAPSANLVQELAITASATASTPASAKAADGKIADGKSRAQAATPPLTAGSASAAVLPPPPPSATLLAPPPTPVNPPLAATTPGAAGPAAKPIVAVANARSRSSLTTDPTGAPLPPAAVPVPLASSPNTAPASAAIALPQPGAEQSKPQIQAAATAPTQTPTGLPSDIGQAKIVVTTTTTTATPAIAEPPAPMTEPVATPAPEPGARLPEPSLVPLALHGASSPGAAPGGTQPSATQPPPAAQVAAALIEPVKVALSTPAHANAGPEILSIKLDPIELGKVEIRIERTGDGPARVDLVAERPETLQRLLHDQPQLQQMLDQAGIPAAGRSLHFSLIADTPANPSTSGFAASADAGTGQPGGGFHRTPNGYPGGPAPETDFLDQPTPPASWSRTGLNITA